jgi:hypothetical protein
VTASLPAGVLEGVARAIHDAYRADQAGRKPPDDPALAEWDELAEYLKESNREQARAIPEKLRAIGCTVYEVRDGKAGALELTDAEVELMAELEAARWQAERRRDGWRWGPQRDVAAKVSPYVGLTWAELPEDVREWDREAVRRIPQHLAAAGLELRRAVSP